MTIRDLINTAEEPYRSQLLENCDNYCIDDTVTYDKLSDEIYLMFVWEDSPQRHIYWRDYVDYLKSKGL